MLKGVGRGFFCWEVRGLFGSRKMWEIEVLFVLVFGFSFRFGMFCLVRISVDERVFCFILLLGNLEFV